MSESSRKQDEIRDEKLARQGFEVYRVADWWCQIDPWRVITEVLTVAGIIPEAGRILNGLNWESTDQYICAECGEPMVRADFDWIVNIAECNKEVLTHRACSEQ